MNNEKRIILLKCMMIIFLIFLPSLINAVNALLTIEPNIILNRQFNFKLNIFSAISSSVNSFQVSFPIILLIIIGNDSFKNYGFNKIRIKHLTISLFRLAGINISVLIAFRIVNIIFNGGFNSEEFTNDTIKKIFNSESNNIHMIIINIIPIMFMAFTEELCFRSYLYINLNKLIINKYTCMIIINLLFSICHIYQGIIPSIQLFIFGLILSIEFEKNNNIFTIAIFHSLNNIYAFLIKEIIRMFY
jgi:membrane protease YdiL (CAAX protease family)